MDLSNEEIRKFTERAHYVASKFGRSDLAEDFTQEMFLAFAEGRHGATVDQLFIDYLRKTFGRSGTSGGEQRKLIAARTFSLDEPVGDHPDSPLGHDLVGDPRGDLELGREYGRIVGLLAGRDRELVELYYSEGWTLKEIAEKYGVTESRMSHKLSWILSKLRERLKRDPDFREIQASLEQESEVADRRKQRRKEMEGREQQAMETPPEQRDLITAAEAGAIVGMPTWKVRRAINASNLMQMNDSRRWKLYHRETLLNCLREPPAGPVKVIRQARATGKNETKGSKRLKVAPDVSADPFAIAARAAFSTYRRKLRFIVQEARRLGSMEVELIALRRYAGLNRKAFEQALDAMGAPK